VVGFYFEDFTKILSLTFDIIWTQNDTGLASLGGIFPKIIVNCVDFLRCAVGEIFVVLAAERYQNRIDIHRVVFCLFSVLSLRYSFTFSGLL